MNDFFPNRDVDTVLVVNSCARGQAVPESDLDFCVLVSNEMPAKNRKAVEKEWIHFSTGDASILKYKKSTPFAHLHVDIINGVYTPKVIENGEPIDYFEVAMETKYVMLRHSITAVNIMESCRKNGYHIIVKT